MTIQALTRALSVISLLVPVVASANSGLIRFSGAIVEPAACKVDIQGGTGGKGAPRVSCGAFGGGSAVPAGNRVTVSTGVSSAVSWPDGRVRRHKVVTLDYL